MAKMTVTVDNNLDDVKLESSEKLKSKSLKESKKNSKEKKAKTGRKNFFNDVRNEMKLVTWPSKKNVLRYSIAAIFMIIFLALFFIGIAAIFDLLYGLVQGWIG